ncbi:MAG: CHAD domain-containing protein [Dehalococcoidia bacterium]|nr:CHAD domain-containing protein [Dehalococcoidia bacterium]
MKIQWNLRTTAASNAKTRLPVLAREFFRSGDKLAAAGAGPEQAHRFRIAAKQFRYTLELFRTCYDQELEHRLGMLKAVQQCLGDLNDLVTVQNLAEGEQMKAALEVRIRAKIQEFHNLWAQQFDRKIQGSWVRYLSGRAAAKKTVPTVG